MKYHKIHGVELSTCTAEQKIAYNLAWAEYDKFLEEYKRMPMQSQKDEVVHACVRWCIKMWNCTPRNRNSKYDIDAIFCALNAGMENYFNAKYHILTSYDAIGEMFPANYL